MYFDSELDARKLTCFMLTLRAKKMLDGIGSGRVLKITTRDPGSVNEFRAFTDQTGNDLVASSEADGEYTFFIKKK
jgi:tRNA 2-thiouridine synthesizing protein A